jgi:VanZ family protein
MAVTRRACAVGLLALIALAVAGSLTPFDFRPLSFTTAVHLFLQIQFVPEMRLSRTDVASNILLFLPIGFAFGATLDDRRLPPTMRRRLMMALQGLSAVFALSAAIEFAQTFLPSRIVAGSDILAETTGGCLGLIAWMGSGREALAVAQDVAARREPSTPGTRLLAAYAAVFAVSQLYPFDVTIRPTELAEKFHAGRIHWQLVDPITRYWLVMLIAGIPIGVLAVLGWPPKTTRRHVANALALGSTAVVATELAQLFIYSRTSRLSDALALTIGAAAGVVSAAWRSTRPSAPLCARPLTWGRAARLAVSVAALVAFVAYSVSWSPLALTNPELVKVHLRQFADNPLLGRYVEAGRFLISRLLLDGGVAFCLGGLWAAMIAPRSAAPTRRLQAAVVWLVFVVISSAVVVVELAQPNASPDLAYVALTALAGVTGYLVSSPGVRS